MLVLCVHFILFHFSSVRRICTSDRGCYVTVSIRILSRCSVCIESSHCAMTLWTLNSICDRRARMTRTFLRCILHTGTRRHSQTFVKFPILNFWSKVKYFPASNVRLVVTYFSHSTAQRIYVGGLHVRHTSAEYCWLLYESQI